VERKREGGLRLGNRGCGGTANQFRIKESPISRKHCQRRKKTLKKTLLPCSEGSDKREKKNLANRRRERMAFEISAEPGRGQGGGLALFSRKIRRGGEGFQRLYNFGERNQRKKQEGARVDSRASHYRAVGNRKTLGGGFRSFPELGKLGSTLPSYGGNSEGRRSKRDSARTCHSRKCRKGEEGKKKEIEINVRVSGGRTLREYLLHGRSIEEGKSRKERGEGEEPGGTGRLM